MELTHAHGIRALEEHVIPSPAWIPRTCSQCGRSFIGAASTVKCARCRHPEVKPIAAPRPIAGQPLSLRENQIVELLAEGLCNKDISAALGLTTGTVKVYVTRISLKLGIHGRHAIGMWAIQNAMQKLEWANEALRIQCERKQV